MPSGEPANPRYHVPRGGLPAQTELTTDRAVFTEAYAVIPARTMSDITASALPHWDATRLWVIARPLSGFAETFSQYVVEVSPGGGSERPEPDPEAEGVLFVVDGVVAVTVEGESHELGPGGYAFLPPGCRWTLRNEGGEAARFHWIRKAYERVDGIEPPEPFVANETDVQPLEMPGTQ
jgi:(S)-ureidoglycine aminohydrolase